MSKPILSICIPSYERTEYLKRLLDSIKIQKFKNFEVIFTDDSKTSQVEDFVASYKADFPILYYRNIPSLGTARNMVEGFKYANSEWIKQIHDDDFFVSDTAFDDLFEATTHNAKFIFSGFNTFNENSGNILDRTLTQEYFQKLIADPSLLFANNPLGPPSVTMVHKSVTDVYDVTLKWFTDVEYYLRVFAKENAYYINKPLVNISINDSQVTSYTQKNAAIVIPEALYIINKHGAKVTSNVVVYDAWWRIFRNMCVANLKDLEQYNINVPIPQIVKTILIHQAILPKKLLKIGVFSKICMGLSYLIYRCIRGNRF